MVVSCYPYDPGSCLCRPKNERTVLANLKSVGDITAFKLKSVPNHQASFTPVQPQLTSAFRYKSAPFNERSAAQLNCFFNEKKKGITLSRLSNPSCDFALLKNSDTTNFKTEAIFWRKSSRNAGFLNTVILFRSKFSLACLYSNRSFVVHPQAPSWIRYSTSGLSIWTTCSCSPTWIKRRCSEYKGWCVSARH